MCSFAVDAMLGKLALWLRLTGHDTFYGVDTDDDELLRVANSENRILLTSDADLHGRAVKSNIRGMLVRGSVDEAVVNVFIEFGIAPTVDSTKSRCSKCNGELIQLVGTEKERIRDLVHRRTYDYYEKFWLCKDCQSVFFQGGYWRNILEYMEKIEVLMRERRDV
ncbi:MAG: hypothetical protein GQ580_01140 [Candidatus Thorarchaeota archaeon]|nr:hypothetical protein [Candidatus Thorarchaeota archaeon]